MEERLERQARNEALVREVNERINALDRDAAGSGAVAGVETFRFHCECGREGGCAELIWMTLEEYEVVRGQDDQVRLRAARRQPRGGAGPLSTSDQQPRLLSVGGHGS